jgi:UDP-N-acetyl-D-mannosaminuronate dehydrogenase
VEYSISPDGEQFTLPQQDDYRREYERLSIISKREREKGREIVVVMGLGFVGAVMAAVAADSVDKETGEPKKFVIGMQRPSIRSFWKIPLFNKGISPVSAEDPAVKQLIDSGVRKKKSLTATYTYDALKLADVLILDVQCDFVKQDLSDLQTGHVEMGAIEESFKIIGRLLEPNCLVLIETTVPPGTTENIAYPIIKKAFKKRGIETEPLLAHSFERVMPGRDYVRSIRHFWRVCSGINKESEKRVIKFLSEIIDVENYPLWKIATGPQFLPF